VLAQLKDQWHGTLILIGQPSEETVDGARAMLADGLYERLAGRIRSGQHDDPGLPAVGGHRLRTGPGQRHLGDVAILRHWRARRSPRGRQRSVVMAANTPGNPDHRDRQLPPQQPAVVTSEHSWRRQAQHYSGRGDAPAHLAPTPTRCARRFSILCRNGPGHRCCERPAARPHAIVSVSRRKPRP